MTPEIFVKKSMNSLFIDPGVLVVEDFVKILNRVHDLISILDNMLYRLPNARSKTHQQQVHD